MFKLPKYKYYFAISDIILLTISFLFAGYIFEVLNKVTHGQTIVNTQTFIVLFLVLSFIIIFEFNSLYKIHLILSQAAHLTALVKSLFFGIIYIIIFSFLLKSSNIIDSTLVIFIFSVSSLLLLFFGRIIILRNLYIKLNHKQFKRNVLIIGNGKSGQILATKLLFENPIGINIIGFLDESREINEEVVEGKKVLGGLNDLEKIMASNKVNEILISNDDDDYEKLLAIIDQSQKFDVNVKVTSQLFDIVHKKLSTEKYGSIPVIETSNLYKTSISMYFKRISDIIASLLALIILSPLFMMIAFLIKVTSKGPVFFRQTRIGKNGKPFQFFKFRSMYVAVGEDEERKKQMLEFMKTHQENTKIINDRRLTKIGKIIRKTSLDELPQLFNVILGDMSLVGPRPCLPYEYKHYDNWQKRRVSVLPGCTGVWQVSGRSSVSFKDSIILDLYYVNNMSPWLDLKLILKTLPVMILARGGK
jgi:exopolysaccharide biosynthesis polyprenyl glycosylphosphotransferase